MFTEETMTSATQTNLCCLSTLTGNMKEEAVFTTPFTSQKKVPDSFTHDLRGKEASVCDQPSRARETLKFDATPLSERNAYAGTPLRHVVGVVRVTPSPSPLTRNSTMRHATPVISTLAGLSPRCFPPMSRVTPSPAAGARLSPRSFRSPLSSVRAEETLRYLSE